MQAFSGDYSGAIQCPKCTRTLNIAIKEVYGNTYGLVQGVKLVKIQLSLPSLVPKAVKDDFDESLRCFNESNAFKSTVVMCRRALESVAESKGITGGNLADKLTTLNKKGFIDNATLNTATGIRQFGNYGSHPQDDLLKDIGEFEAEMVLKITGRLLNEIFRK